MPFNSYLFLLGFLPLAVAVYRGISAPGKRRLWLLACGCVFYAGGAAAHLPLLLGMTAVAFLGALAMARARTPAGRRLGLALALVNLAVLAVVKYLATRGHPLPLGVSFYTFNLVGYALDVYWGRAAVETSPTRFAAYATFFPTISSGPLMRYDDFRGQEQAPPPEGSLELGVFNVAMGLAKKLLIADPLGAVVDPLFGAHATLGSWGAWLAVLGYHFRVYFDFSGYTDIAIGVGYLLGLKLPPNFDAPYTSRSMTEFWQRWHMSLSFWFRDYVFLPLAFWLRARDPARRAGPARSVSLLVTMTLIGLWHGVTLPFVAWGLYQGVLLAVHATLRAAGRKPWPPLAGRAATFAALMAGWVILRSGSVEMAGGLFAAMLGLRGAEPTPLHVPGVSVSFLATLAVLLLLTNLRRDVSQLRPRPGWAYAAGIAALLTIGLLSIGQPSPFLYFQF
jgi:alginate O-acetyltransferase complex protein AlgI